ncbi:hypothetical protein VTP01DRAFT_5172 [Rhizomucor pusillus]|uniref:uncharacterized protein n=1 Tax=Rhizomucor pusillus TaxID=4840 RepID=UPI003742C00F
MSDPQKLRTAVNRHFVDSGEKERLLGILRSRLVESGWNDLVYAYATEMARNKNQDNVTMETLLENTADYARSTMHESIKKEMLVLIKRYLDSAFD